MMISMDNNHHQGTTNSHHMKSSSSVAPSSAASITLSQQSSWLEVRLFYVRIAPCVVDSVPDSLTLRHPRRETGASLEVNGVRIPSSQTASLKLRRDRVDRESSEATYVSTETVRVAGGHEIQAFTRETDDFGFDARAVTGDDVTGIADGCLTSDSFERQADHARQGAFDGGRG